MTEVGPMLELEVKLSWGVGDAAPQDVVVFLTAPRSETEGDK